MDIFTKLKEGLAKTRSQIISKAELGQRVDENFFNSLEEALVMADVGLDLTLEIIDDLKNEIKLKKIDDVKKTYEILKEILVSNLRVNMNPDEFPPKPWVVLVVGVNGVGKTTTIAKIANGFRMNNKSVMLCAADTFRAGAIEQLRIWAQRTESDFIAQHEGADAASVAFDALEAAKSRGIDTLIIDTAGRLHTKVNLISELEKIVRVIKRNSPSAPNEILLIVDATTGQNAINQADVFHKALGLTGIVITKLDGTAKGGVALALVKRLSVPIRKVGVGEGLSDLQDFNPETFIEAMFGHLS